MMATWFAILSFLYTLLTAHAMAFSPQSLGISTRLMFALSVRERAAAQLRNRGVPHTANIGSGPPNMSSFTTNTSTPNDDDDEKQFIKSYTIHGVGKGSRVDIRTNTGHELCTDVPRTNHGRHRFGTPASGNAAGSLARMYTSNGNVCWETLGATHTH
jgi:hypothetical protein